MDNIMKMVRFDIYCRQCEHRNDDETKDPCNECLGIPERPYTDIPEYWTEKS